MPLPTSYPIGFLYGIFTGIYMVFTIKIQPHLGKYTIPMDLVGGWTTPFEKYARQIRSFPQGSGET